MTKMRCFINSGFLDFLAQVAQIIWRSCCQTLHETDTLILKEDSFLSK